MAMSESERREVFDALARVHGDEIAAKMMNMLPYQPIDELVTRTDLAATRAALEGQMTALRAELKGELAELRGEMAQLEARMESGLAGLRADVRTEIAGLQKWAAGILATNGVALAVALIT